MSKINAVRLINVNYNNNAYRISDETLHFNGKSTLISLQNGGGKSVLVQMLTAPFVHPKYRNTKDRLFESYFTTNKPSFILVEWALDQGAGYVLTGLMVRKSQDMEEDRKENLDIIGIVSEYQSPCIQDIHHLPVVEKGKKEMILKNFNSCRQLFETYKKDRDMKFFYYDLTNYAQSRQYFNKLMEYQINYKEWETIIKKINLKESGLSDLFADCKDEKGLTEKWFLEAIESKLNKDKNRIKEFQSILEKYAGQYKDNRSKIKRRDTIRQFKEEANGIQTQAEEYQNAETEEGKQQNKIAWFIHDVNGLLSQTEKAHDHAKEVLEGLDQKLSRVEYEELSSQVYDYEEEKNLHIGNRDMIDMERENLQVQAEQTEKKLHILQCARQQDSVSEEKGELDLLREKIAVARQQGADLEPERKALGLTLKNIFEERIQDNRQQQENLSENIQKKGKEAQDEANRVEELEEKIRKFLAILADRNLLLRVVREEILAIADKYGDERRTAIGYDVYDLSTEDLIPRENTVITMTKLGYIKRMTVDNFRSQNRGGRGIKGMQTIDDDYIEELLMTTTHHYLMFFTNTGRVYRLKAYEIPEAGRTARGTAIVNLLQLMPGERITSVIPMRKFEEGKYLVMATKAGLVKKTPMEEYANVRKTGLVAITLRDDDELIEVKATDDTKDIMLVTKDGMCIRFKETDVRSTGRSSMGVRGMNLDPGDEVVAMQLNSQGDYLLVVSENGMGKRTAMSEFTCQNRGGKGVKCYKITEKTGNVIGAKAVNEENEIMMITTEGIIIRITCAGISILGRITSGVKLINLDEGVTVASLAKVREKAEGNTENGSSEEPTEETEEVFEEEDSQDTNDAE